MTRKPARRLSDLSPAQLQLLVVELQRKLAAAPAAKPAEPLAIVGLAGRYPGTDGTLDTFWDMMAERRCAIRTAGAGGPRRLNAGAQDRIVDGGYLDGIEVSAVGRFEEGFLSEMRADHADLLAAIRDEQVVSDATEAKLKEILDEYARTFA